jgi:hypothetical protein
MCGARHPVCDLAHSYQDSLPFAPFCPSYEGKRKSEGNARDDESLIDPRLPILHRILNS